MKDLIVIDIETTNTFFDVGKDNFDALEVSVVGTYSYNNDKYVAYEKNQMKDVGNLFRNAGLIIGFAIIRFDFPVLNKYFDFNIFSIPNLDILDEIERAIGKRISLDLLAKENLGYGKTGKGFEAPTLYKEGKIKELKDYCLNDVKVTKELYDLVNKRGYLLIPQKYEENPIKVELDWREKLVYQRLF